MNTPAVRDQKSKIMVEDVNALKTKGNEAFSREDYAAALEYYNIAIDGVKAAVPKNESESFGLAHIYQTQNS
jgi:hypothetical protein